jgi:hypothetical protein
VGYCEALWRSPGGEQAKLGIASGVVFHPVEGNRLVLEAPRLDDRKRFGQDRQW